VVQLMFGNTRRCGARMTDDSTSPGDAGDDATDAGRPRCRVGWLARAVTTRGWASWAPGRGDSAGSQNGMGLAMV